jgi:hypothetical protein
LEDRHNLDNIVKKGRGAFKSLCTIAAQSIANNPRAGVPISTPRHRSKSATPVLPEASQYEQRLRPHSGMPGARSGTRAGSRASSQAGSQAGSRDASPAPAARKGKAPAAAPKKSAKKATKAAEAAAADLKRREEQYGKDGIKPNLHVGLHFDMVAQEYRLPANLNVLIGEDKHR